MPFTAQELANISNSVLDNHLFKGQVFKQARQAKPMYDAFDSAAKEFPGGKGKVTIRVARGTDGPGLQGYTHDDIVTYGNPTPTKQVEYPWKEMHQGIGLTHTELKHDGITVIEDGAAQTTREKDGREEFALANLLQEKLDEMNEGYLISMDSLLHGDGTGDTKAISGIRSLILDDPSSGTTGGLSRSAFSWWRNHAATTAAQAAGSGDDAVTSSTDGGGALLQYLQKQYRQMLRFGTPRHRCFAGSDFLGAQEKELRANGSYTDRGFRNRGAVNGGMNTIRNGVPFLSWDFEYDPTLDDLNLQKRAYIIDMNAVMLYYMRGEKQKRANPARPYDRYVMYRGVTTTGVLAAKQLNTSMVIDIA